MRSIVLLLVVVLATASPLPARPQSAAAVTDAWGPIIAWRAHTGQSVAAIHATLMRDGRILLFGADSPFGFLMTPSPAGTAPGQVTMVGFRTPVEFPEPGVPYGIWSNVKDTLYCAGHATMEDGSVFIAGGTRTLSLNAPTGPQTHFVGLNYAAILGLSPAAWRRIPARMIGTGTLRVPERWYPTVTRLGDGRMLVTSGADYIVPPAATSTNRSVEV